MPTPEEWRAHARSTRSAAARATRFGAHEFARTLLRLADDMDRQAARPAAAPPPAPVPSPACALLPVRCCAPVCMPRPANDPAAAPNPGDDLP